MKNRTQKITALRLFVQAASLLVIFSTVMILAKWNSVVLAVIIFVLPIFLGRFFCGWICPLGFYMDLVSLVRKVTHVRYRNLSERVNRLLHKLRYVLAASMLALPFFYGALDPQVWEQFLFFNGPFKPLIVYFLGPLEPLLIPYPGLVGFGDYSLSFPYMRGFELYFPEFLVTASILAFVVTVLAGSFVVRRFWCRFCPTGVSVAAVNRFRSLRGVPLLRLNKVEEKCTKCGICKRVCPVQVTDVYELKGGDITTSMCLLCLRCVEMCPYEGCLKVNAAGKTLIKSRNWLEPAKTD